jgi:electron transfer flavoprotein alpha subunit
MNPRILRKSLSTLVVLEHKADKLTSSSLHSLSAAIKLGFPVTCLVTGNSAVASQASVFKGISKYY